MQLHRTWANDFNSLHLMPCLKQNHFVAEFLCGMWYFTMKLRRASYSVNRRPDPGSGLPAQPGNDLLGILVGQRQLDPAGK